jgi:fimbrial chaperone protein
MMKNVYLQFGSRLTATVIVFAVCFGQEAWAFKFQPMSISFDVNSKKPHKMLYVENDGKKRIAIQLSVAQRVMDIKGKEKHPSVEKIFSIYPSQLILKPKERRSVRLSLNKRINIESEQAYRIIAEQLPIEIEKVKDRSSGIKVLFRYVGALYLTFKKAKSNVHLLKGELDEKSGKLMLRLNNSGTKHQLLNGLKVVIKGKTSDKRKKSEVRLEGSQLKGMLGENMLAGITREFDLPWPKTLWKDSKNKLEVDISFEQ